MPQGSVPRPAVTVAYAQTLDGRVATISGSSQWISGPESLRVTHELRAAHDAIMVGVGTVCADDPRLTVRLAPGNDPLRVVVDSTLRTPLGAAVLAEGAATGTIVATTERASHERRTALAALGTSLLLLPGLPGSGRVDLAALLAALHERGVASVMVEGGAQLITALLRAQLVDRLSVCVAPKLLGRGIDAIGDLGIDCLDHALTLDGVQATMHGRDLIIDGRVVYARAPVASER